MDATGYPSPDEVALLNTLPVCPRCKTRILNPLRRTCGSCFAPIPLTVRDPSKAHLSEGIALPDDSAIRPTALKIVALRQGGLSDEEIGQILGLKKSTLTAYLYKAGANGWLDDVLVDPKERMELQILDKVVRRLDEALDSDTTLNTGMLERTAVALKLGEGTLYNRPGEVSQAAVQSTLIGVRVEVVGGVPQQMREGTISGTSKYLEAETVKETP